MTTTNTRNASISITETAAQQVRKLSKAQGLEHNGLRVSIQGGGCSGLVYKLGMENDEREGDNVYEEHGVKLFIDKKSVIFLVGTELDFSDGLNGKGFVFANPNAKKACGCGNSFSV